MPRNSISLLFPQMKRVKQITEAHCGPACVEMLLSCHGISITQDEVVHTAGVAHKLETHGMLLSEMGVAVSKLVPGFHLLYKRNSTIGELSSLINTYKMPVGVEWQGIFEDVDDAELEESGYEDGDDDPGHYSVVTGISTAENWLTLADPYLNKGSDRQLTILEFERRWWDINEILDLRTHHHQEMDDYHAIFIILPISDGTGELFHLESI